MIVSLEKRVQHKLPWTMNFPDFLLNFEFVLILWEHSRETTNPEWMTAVVIDSHGIIPVLGEPPGTIPINKTSHFAVE